MTNLELLEEIKKDYLAKFENDPSINRICNVIINEFKARMFKLDLPVVVKYVKEKETMSFQKWANTKGYYQIGIEWFSDSGYPRQYTDLIKMYKEECQL